MFLPWQFDNDTLFFLLLAVLRVSKIQTIFSDQLEFQKLLFSWNKKAFKQNTPLKKSYKYSLIWFWALDFIAVHVCSKGCVTGAGNVALSSRQSENQNKFRHFGGRSLEETRKPYLAKERERIIKKALVWRRRRSIWQRKTEGKANTFQPMSVHIFRLNFKLRFLFCYHFR